MIILIIILCKECPWPGYSGTRRTFFFVAMKTPSMRCFMWLKHLGYLQHRQSTNKAMLFYQWCHVSLSFIFLLNCNQSIVQFIICIKQQQVWDFLFIRFLFMSTLQNLRVSGVFWSLCYDGIMNFWTFFGVFSGFCGIQIHRNPFSLG